jgi:hypothetical protein
MVNTRVVPALGPGGSVTAWAGGGDPVAGGRRYYSCNAGSFVDVPGDPSGDAAVLTSQGFVLVGMAGATNQRPTSTGYLKPGQIYVDTTLNAVLVWTGVGWVSALTGAAA